MYFFDFFMQVLLVIGLSALHLAPIALIIYLITHLKHYIHQLIYELNGNPSF